MALLTCLICTKNKKESLSKKLSEKCHPIQTRFSTILDMLKFCIPKLFNLDDISADATICTKCLSKLKACVEFIDQCLSGINKHKFKEKTVKVEIEDCERNVVETVLVGIKQELKEANTGQSEGQSDTRQKSFNDQNESDVQNIIDDTHDSWEEDDGEFDVQCDFCREKFPTEDILKEHITKNHNTDLSKKLKTKKSPFSCDECQIKFKSLKQLKQHLKTAHSITTFSCIKCGREFSSQLRLTAHEDLYKDRETCKLQCERCGREFKCKPDFLRHLEKEKDAPTCDYETCKVCLQKFSKEEFKVHLVVHPRKICETCGEGFPDWSALYQHKMSHNEPNQAICPVCGKGFVHSQRLSNHLRYVHEYAERKYPCTQCPKKFFNKLKLKFHIKSHDNIKDIPCPECGRMFLSKTLLTTHFNAVHLKLRPFACTQCDKKFTRNQHLQKHLETHIRSKVVDFSSIVVENPGLPVKCYHCGKILKNLSQLKLHIKIVHIRVRRFKCEFCEMRFICKITQMRHQEKHKDPLYKFRCKICYKKNKSEEELTNHLKKHKKFPFQCNICSEEFGRSYLLENHMLSEHPGAGSNTPQQIINEALQNAIFVDVDNLKQ